MHFWYSLQCGCTMSSNRGLTQREEEILGLVGLGRTSRQIADALNLSVYTVNNHRKHICRKLGLHSTAQLVAFAARHHAHR